MSMEIKQQMRLSQQLVMTPQLQQAIKLLQMSRLDVIDRVHEEMLENPVLEDAADIRSADADPADTRALTALEEQVARDDREALDRRRESEVATNEIDWERYLENHSLQAPMPSARAANWSDDMPSLESTYSRSEDLSVHLLRQIGTSDFLEEEQRFAMLVVGNLDEQGYLKLEGVPPRQVVPVLAEEAGIDAEDAEEVLKMIQQLDPVGVASRNLGECLKTQAVLLGLDEQVIAVIERHLINLERRNFQIIARDLGVSVEDVYDIAQMITELEPRPDRSFASQQTQYITPDVYVHKVGDDYFVVPNDDGLPRLKISGFYRNAIGGDDHTKEYIQAKLRSAQWLIRSLEQRRKTIIRVTECIVEKQKAFFDKGIEHLKPMILRDVAEAVELHESTISRVTSNKYVHTPRGVFELKFFFNSAIKRDYATDIASESVKQAIKKRVDAEDPKAPLSDQKLVDHLAEDGIVIARRTVAKYREMLGILSSSRRKRYY